MRWILHADPKQSAWLSDVPAEEQTPEIVEDFLKHRRGYAEHLAPEHWGDIAFVRVFLTHYASATPRFYIRDSVWNQEMLELAVKNHAWQLCHLPPRWRTVDICSELLLDVERGLVKDVPISVFDAVKERIAALSRTHQIRKELLLALHI